MQAESNVRNVGYHMGRGVICMIRRECVAIETYVNFLTYIETGSGRRSGTGRDVLNYNYLLLSVEHEQEKQRMD